MSENILLKRHGGVNQFTELADTPPSYSSHSLKGVRVNAGENALEFYTTVTDTDEKVAVDSEATAGYLGAASNDGVLRTGSPLTYTDGGDFITLDIDETLIDHDVLTNTHNLTTDIDHTTIQNIGTNSHADIDSHIADSDIHFRKPIEDGSAAGQMAFWDGSTWKHTETSELFWHDTSKLLGIGTNNPNMRLTVDGGIETLGSRAISPAVSAASLSIENEGEYAELHTFPAETPIPLKFGASGFIFNEDGLDADFRIEGDTEANLFFLDASTDRIGVGTNAADARLHTKLASGRIFEVEKTGDERIWYIDTTNIDHIKKVGNIVLSADPNSAVASTLIQMRIDGVQEFEFRDNHIYFGSAEDTNIYRSAANLLRTDDTFQAGGYKSSDGSTGVTGTFVDRNGFTVTVKNGIITDFGVG